MFYKIGVLSSTLLDPSSSPPPEEIPFLRDKSYRTSQQCSQTYVLCVSFNSNDHTKNERGKSNVKIKFKFCTFSSCH